MSLFKVLTWIFIALAFVFFFFSLRSSKNEVTYTFIALGMWGVAYLLNKFKPGKKKDQA